MKKFIVFAAIVLNFNYIPINAYSDTQVDKNWVSVKSESKKSSSYNVIIVCLDTLRADHVGCYGYPKDTTPNIDKLSRKGIIFEWAFAQSNFTLPSHAWLFTSKYVHSHKVDRIERTLSDKETALA